MLVLAIRIYYGEFAGTVPFADLIMSDGVCETIVWTDVKQRKQFAEKITGYTLVYDERPKRDWNEWIH